jgi:hypothetical protein
MASAARAIETRIVERNIDPPFPAGVREVPGPNWDESFSTRGAGAMASLMSGD